jgi:acetylornithine/LysW-gamma-L-lysine aminotransferase
MNADEIMEVESAHTSGLYGKQPIIFVRGLGASLFDINDVEYIDCNSGHGVANLGHAHPKVAAAIALQSTRLITLFETFYNDQRATLMKIMGPLVPGLPRVFFCNSGTESVEAAIKFARISTGRPGIVATMRAFHGRTYGALSATYNKKYREGFEPLVPGYSHIPYNNVEALEKAIDENTAAFIVEAVQGEGAFTPSTLSTSRLPAAFAMKKAHCSSSMKFKAVSEELEECLLSSTLASPPTCCAAPNPLLAACQWALF